MCHSCSDKEARGLVDHREPFRSWDHQARYAKHTSDMFSILSAPGDHRKRYVCALHPEDKFTPSRRELKT
jgi:hypothetical protein